jgi:hypothetical protein
LVRNVYKVLMTLGLRGVPQFTDAEAQRFLEALITWPGRGDV